jgi:cardiolipin synthase
MSVKKSIYNIPNLLCLFRIAVIPVMLLLFYCDGPVTVWINVALFALAGISDYLDGVIARAWNQTTVLGKFLDSSTDKMLVGAALFLLVAFERLDGAWLIPAAIIYLREILVAGVREFMAIYNVVVPVSRLGKWKLTMQVVSIAFLIPGHYGNTVLPYSYDIGRVLFLVATVITVLSGWNYTYEAWKNIKLMDAEGKIH